MTKQDLQNHWDNVLASEGMAEVSLFDNTGKNARAITFVSTTTSEPQRFDSHDNAGTGWNTGPWEERRNLQVHGEQVAFADHPNAVYWRDLTATIQRLPPGWPELDKKVLQAWADCGNFNQARKLFDVTPLEAARIRRRFDEWKRNQC